MRNDLQAYLKENARHGTPGLPIGFYHCQVPGDFIDLLTHWHEDFELTLVREGQLLYVIGPFSGTVQAGDLLLVGPDTLHAAHRLPEENAVTDSIVFQLSLLGGNGEEDDCTAQYVRPCQEGKLLLPPVLHPGEEGYAALLDCFLALWDCREKDSPYRPLRVKSALYRLLEQVWRCAQVQDVETRAALSTPYEEKLKRVLAYIQAHYAETLTVEQLARLCGFSQVHFMNIFKKTIGSTCVEYLVEYRLSRAALELATGGESVTRIAMNSGFPNVSYFNRMFKKKYRMTPTEYRRSHAAG